LDLSATKQNQIVTGKVQRCLVLKQLNINYIQHKARTDKSY